MSVLKKLDRVLDNCEEFVSAITMLSMCLVVFAGVICRFVLKISFPTSEEISRYLMIWVIYIGISIAARQKAHVNVEVFINAFPGKGTKVLKIIGQLITILAFFWLFVLAVMFVARSLGPNPQLTPLTRIPYAFLYLSMAIGFGLSVLRSLQVFFKDFIIKKDTVEIEIKEEDGN